MRGGVGCWILFRFFSVFGNFGENVYIRESEKPAQLPNSRTKEISGNYRQLAPSVCLSLCLSFSLSGALSQGRVDPASALVLVGAVSDPPPGKGGRGDIALRGASPWRSGRDFPPEHPGQNG